MDVKPSEDAGTLRQRRRLSAAIKQSLRALRLQLSLLNLRVGAHLELKEVDIDCLDLVARYGPLSPSALARRAGLHPATMTGVLDRLEQGGWVARERDPTDRRAVLVRARHERTAELMHLYAGMNASMDDICAGYDDAEIQRRHPFQIRDVLMSAIFAAASSALAAVAEAFERPTSEADALKAWCSRSSQAVQQSWDTELNVALDYDIGAAAHVRVETCAGLAPLVVPELSAEMVEGVLKRLAGPGFAGAEGHRDPPRPAETVVGSALQKSYTMNSIRSQETS